MIGSSGKLTRGVLLLEFFTLQRGSVFYSWCERL